MKQVVLITGGTSGIGLATAKLLSSEGAKIIVTGRNPETLAAVQRQAAPGHALRIRRPWGETCEMRSDA